MSKLTSQYYSIYYYKKTVVSKAVGYGQQPEKRGKTNGKKRVV